MTTTPETDETYDFTKTSDTMVSGGLLDKPVKATLRDPDLAPVAEKSDLDLIAEDLAADISDESIVLPVETRPGYQLRFDTDISWEQFEKWRKAAKDRKASGGIDVSRLASLVVANKCTGILKDGRPLTDNDGDVLTFASDEIRAMFQTLRAADAAKMLIGRDSLLQAISDAVINAAGWGDEVSEVDPTAPAL